MTQPHARDRSFRRSSIRAGSRAYLETRSGAGRLRSGSAIPKAILAIGLLFAWAPAAQAVTVGFGCITSNDATDCAIGEAQLTVEVSDAGGGEVLFLFENAGPASSSITGVFFDDGTLLGISGLIDADDDALDIALEGKLPQVFDGLFALHDRANDLDHPDLLVPGAEAGIVTEGGEDDEGEHEEHQEETTEND